MISRLSNYISDSNKEMILSLLNKQYREYLSQMNNVYFKGPLLKKIEKRINAKKDKCFGTIERIPLPEAPSIELKKYCYIELINAIYPNIPLFKQHIPLLIDHMCTALKPENNPAIINPYLHIICKWLEIDEKPVKKHYQQLIQAVLLLKNLPCVNGNLHTLSLVSSTIILFQSKMVRRIKMQSMYNE